VRSLRRTSRPLVDRGIERPPRDPFRIMAGILAVESSWSPPFGNRLTKALCTDSSERQLELGCAAEDGAFEAFYWS
jgi:hypothetical protein